MNEDAEPSERCFQPAPHTSRYVEAPGARLHYLDYGTAGWPPILCVHGGAAHGHWFDFFAPGFTARHHVHALDLRGHGDSEWMNPPAYTYQLHASDLAHVIERLELRDLVLVGHSMGGLVSLVYVATHPERVRALVVVDSTLRMPEERAALLREVGSRPGSRYSTADELASHYRLQPAGSTAPPEIVRYLAERGARQLPDGTWTYKFDRHVYGQRTGLDGVPYLRHIAVPVLLVKGDRSNRITPEALAEARALCPYLEFVEVPHSDHHVFLDNPPGFERVVKEFLAKH